MAKNFGASRRPRAVQGKVASPSPSPARSNESSFFGRHQFFICRLFSLAGLFFSGYVLVHLLTNASLMAGVAMFQSSVDRIHSLGPALPFVEWAFLFIPIIFHSLVGWAIIAGAVPNVGIYNNSSNIRYTLQRVTAVILFFFILGHVLHLHHLGDAFGGGKFNADHAASSLGEALQAALWIQLFYMLGALSAAYHVGNGMWTFGITWGLWVSDAAQKRATKVCAAVGVLIAAAGITSVIAARRVNVPEAIIVENRMAEARRFLQGEAGSNEATERAADPTAADVKPE